MTDVLREFPELKDLRSGESLMKRTHAADYASDDGKGMNQLRKNLSRVVGPENVTRNLVRDAMRSYARYWLEAFRLPQIAGDPGVVKRIDDQLVGKTHLDAAVAAPTGTILVLPHSGNWDMAGMYFAATYGTSSKIGRASCRERV